eukprot:1069564-Rhodomonas_salina.1
MLLFKQAVITYLVAHGLVFPIDADNVTLAAPAKAPHNYAAITGTKMLRGIQLQLELSDSCTESMETIFSSEALEKHLLKAMHIWKCMADSLHKILTKDR